MLDEMDGEHLTEWLAYEQVVAKEQKRAELAAKAEQGVQNHRRRGRK